MSLQYNLLPVCSLPPSLFFVCVCLPRPWLCVCFHPSSLAWRAEEEEEEEGGGGRKVGDEKGCSRDGVNLPLCPLLLCLHAESRGWGVAW